MDEPAVAALRGVHSALPQLALPGLPPLKNWMKKTAPVPRALPGLIHLCCGPVKSLEVHSVPLKHEGTSVQS